MNLFGTRFPLIQAPMAGSQNARLAVAVCQAGALGSIPAAMLDTEGLHRELQTMSACQRPYNVNFFAHQTPVEEPERRKAWFARLAPYFAELGVTSNPLAAGPSRQPFGPEAAEVLERFRPPVVSFHFGLPRAELLAKVKRLGSLVLSTATTLDEAMWLQTHGADAVIVQGLEAGGHRGHFLSQDVRLQAGLMDLLPRVVEALDIPVIAAGGLADAEGVSACFQSGAQGVQVGTAFLLCPEATTTAVHRHRLLDRSAPTALTNLFSGGLARGLHNRLMHDLGPVCEDAPPFPLAAAAIAPLRVQAEAAGRDDFSPLWSGACRKASEELPAADVVRALMAEFEAARAV